MKRSTFIIVSILCTIIVYRYLTWPHDDAVLKNLNDKVILGNVIEEPSIVRDNTRFVIKIKSINDTQEHFVQIILKNAPKILYGDDIKISGKITNISASSPDYGSYMRARKIFYQIKNPKISIVGNHPDSILDKKLIEIKNIFISKINNLLPQPQSFLGAGLILTGKGSLDDNLQDEFKRVGLIHIVVLSGFNVSIVAIVIMSLLNFLPPIVRFVIGSFFMTCFCLMVGGGASVMRSLVMNIISIFGKTMNLVYDPLKGLFVAGLLMLVFNPMLLFFDPSFQMSFMATLGLIILSDKISPMLSFLPNKFGIKETISCTLSTQIAVTPLIMHLSGIVSLISLLTNVIVLPFIPYTMLFVALAVFSSFIANIFGVIFAFVSLILLSYELWVVHFFASLPFAAVQFSTWSWWQTIFCYFFLIIMYIFFKKKFNPKSNQKEIRMFFERHET